jgi:hypothetical protein
MKKITAKNPNTKGRADLAAPDPTPDSVSVSSWSAFVDISPKMVNVSIKSVPLW